MLSSILSLVDRLSVYQELRSPIYPIDNPSDEEKQRWTRPQYQIRHNLNTEAASSSAFPLVEYREYTDCSDERLFFQVSDAKLRGQTALWVLQRGVPDTPSWDEATEKLVQQIYTCPWPRDRRIYRHLYGMEVVMVATLVPDKYPTMSLAERKQKCLEMSITKFNASFVRQKCESMWRKMFRCQSQRKPYVLEVYIRSNAFVAKPLRVAPFTDSIVHVLPAEASPLDLSPHLVLTPIAESYFHMRKTMAHLWRSLHTSVDHNLCAHRIPVTPASRCITPVLLAMDKLLQHVYSYPGHPIGLRGAEFTTIPSYLSYTHQILTNSGVSLPALPPSPVLATMYDALKASDALVDIPVNKNYATSTQQNKKLRQRKKQKQKKRKQKQRQVRVGTGR